MTKTFKGYTPIEVPRFELESPDGQRKFEVICKGSIPGSKFLDFLTNTKEDDPATLAVAMFDILHAAVRDDIWDDFKAFIDEPENGITVEILAEIAGYLSELYAGRPTAPSPA